MPQTHAERQKKYRERQLQKYGKEAIKKKESKRRKKKRSKYQVGSAERQSKKTKKQTKCHKEIAFKRLSCI